MIGKLQTKTNFNAPFAQLKIELTNKQKKQMSKGYIPQ
jgi:hypothetical protein